MSRPEPSLRQQLIEARRNVARQIEILQAGPASLGRGGEFIDNRSLVADLSDTLRQIDEGLAELGPDEA